MRDPEAGSAFREVVVQCVVWDRTSNRHRNCACNNGDYDHVAATTVVIASAGKLVNSACSVLMVE